MWNLPRSTMSFSLKKYTYCDAVRILEAGKTPQVAQFCLGTFSGNQHCAEGPKKRAVPTVPDNFGQANASYNGSLRCRMHTVCRRKLREAQYSSPLFGLLPRPMVFLRGEGDPPRSVWSQAKAATPARRFFSIGVNYVVYSSFNNMACLSNMIDHHQAHNDRPEVSLPARITHACPSLQLYRLRSRLVAYGKLTLHARCPPYPPVARSPCAAVWPALLGTILAPPGDRSM